MTTRTMRRSPLAIALCAALLTPLPTPGGAALAQSPVAFPRDVYAARRERLAAQVPGAAIIVPGRYLVGVHELPKQDPNFWYLTGVESPYAMLVIAPDARRGARAGAVRT
ncbi:MAG TPA: aminopeptidase P N-terminal domain-containing protein, partial [Gemmatimonadaceae bacterium]|nr:aminopeptidase P N-terminal domain-containing protein [Gemmatimonadaceae bacterium]